MNIYDFIGLIGACCTIYAYAKVQWRRDYAKHMSFSVLNAVSSVLVGASLIHTWNMSSFVLNTMWGIISVYGIYRCTKHKRRSHKKS